MVASFNSLTEQMRDLRAKPTGKLRIQMLPGLAIGHFGSLLAEFTELYPDIEVDVIVNDRVVDPIEEGFDVAFQMFPPLAESLIERKLFSVRRLFCASPEYLERHGAPKVPAELQAHKVALYEGYPSRNKWLFNGSEQVELNLTGQVRSNSVHLLRDYAITGACVVCLPTLVASADLLAGRLVPVLTDYSLTSFNFSAVYPATQRRALKVRSLIEFLVERISDEPDWDRPLLERGWVKE
ncbi:HTH-type transcriptional regulator DmlR [compost metagenome]